MKKKALAIMLVCLLSCCALTVFHVKADDATAEIEWETTFGTDNIEKGVMITQTKDGGYIIVGDSFYSYEDTYLSDILVIKTDSNGNREWENTFERVESEGVYSSEGKYIEQTDDNGFIICGETQRYATTYEEATSFYPKIWLIKIDSNGNEEWNKVYPKTGGFKACQQTSDGGFILSYRHYMYEDVSHLVKTDSEGEEEWSQTFYGLKLTDVLETTEEEFLITGNTGNYKSQLYKLNDAGEEQWNKTLKFYGLKFSEETTEFYLLIGKQNIIHVLEDTLITIQPDYYISLLKIDKSGEILWNKTIARDNINGFELWEMNLGAITSGKTPAYFLYPASDEGYIFICMRSTYYPSDLETNYQSPLWIVKTDKDYNFEWNATIDDVPVESVKQTSDGGYILTGQKSEDIWLLKTIINITYSDDDDTDDVTDEDDDENIVGNGEEETPGFEMVLSLFAIVFLVSFLRKRRK